MDASPDIILLDVMMPEVDGYEKLRALKHEPATRASGDDVHHHPVGGGQDDQAYWGRWTTSPSHTCRTWCERASTPIFAWSTAAVYSSRRSARRTARAAQDTRLEVIRGLGRAAEYRDETGTHVVRISHYARLVALAAGMGEAEADPGSCTLPPCTTSEKIGIPDSILLKPGAAGSAGDWGSG